MKFSSFTIVPLLAAAVAAFQCDPTVFTVDDSNLNSIQIRQFAFFCDKNWTRVENQRFVLRQGEAEYPGSSVEVLPSAGDGTKYFITYKPHKWGSGIVGTHIGLNVCVVYTAFDKDNNRFDKVKCVMGKSSWKANGKTFICPGCERSTGD